MLAVDQDRHTALPGECDRLLVRELPRDRIERQALVHERQFDTPAVRAEAAFRFRSGEIVKLQPHIRMPPQRPTVVAVCPKRMRLDCSVTVGCVLISFALS